MKCALVFFGACILWVTISQASDRTSLASARQAQAMLGDELWSEVIRIENVKGMSRYPRTVHALVFELGGVLWFYTETEGTQNFSTRRGQLAEDKDNYAPLLSAIHSGFSRWSVLPTSSVSKTRNWPPLRNGCFIDSVVMLRQQLMKGGEAIRPRILCYIEKMHRHREGHAVLVFDAASGVQVIDPDFPGRPQCFSHESARNPRDLAAALSGRLVAKAVWVPMNDFAETVTTQYAALRKAQGETSDKS